MPDMGADVIIAAAGFRPDGGAGGLCWYFGARYDAFLAMTGELPDGWRLAPAEAVEAAADRLMPSLADLEGHLFDGPPSEDWWAGQLAERNPYGSDLHLSLARALALVQAARAGGRHLVAVDDPSLGRALAATVRGAGLKVRWLGPSARPLAWLPGFARAALAVLRDRWRSSAALRRHRLGPGRLGDRRLWLLTWAGPGFVPAGGRIERDAFLGELPVWLRRWPIPFAWVGLPTGWIAGMDDIAAGVAKGVEPVTFLPALVPWSAHLKAVWRVMTRRWHFKQPDIGGIDLAPMFQRAWEQDVGSGSALRALPYAEVARHCRRLGLAPDLLIYPYENQPWEKLLLLGFRRHLPMTRLVGIQHTVFADRYISAEPTPMQLRAGLFPDILLASGAEFARRLLHRGVSGDRVPLAGNLRFPFLVRQDGAEVRSAVRTVLATLPMQADEGLELAHKAAMAAMSFPGLRLLINFHPMLDEATKAAIRRHIQDLGGGDQVMFVEGGASRWLAESDLLLYNSSGTVFEAAGAGVPAIHVGADCRLDLDKLPGGGPLHCRTPVELAQMIGRLRDDPHAMAGVLAETRAKAVECFAPPDEDHWRALIFGR